MQKILININKVDMIYQIVSIFLFVFGKKINLFLPIVFKNLLTNIFLYVKMLTNTPKSVIFLLRGIKCVIV